MSEELHDYEALIGSFYSSFSNLNRAGMTKCYHRDIHFLDSAFGNLHGEDVSKMWEMLIARSKGNLEISFSDIWVDENYGGAKWVAKYKFGNRPVTNFVTARFKFSEGKILEHSDHFDLWKWSRQAIGPIAYLIGWTGFFQKRLRAKFRNSLFH
jgi:predicted alpha-1,6-mannanase (GH76 family)|tara:strand:- start:2701 stop:3162 length:462 start_codon:yes stop_codon:yes gene_type:complete